MPSDPSPVTFSTPPAAMMAAVRSVGCAVLLAASSLPVNGKMDVLLGLPIRMPVLPVPLPVRLMVPATAASPVKP